MRTPGYLKEPLFYLRTLTLISVLSIGLQTFKVASNILDGSISGQKENLEVRLGELQLRATGKNTTAVVLNLLKILNSSDVEHSNERYSPYTLREVRQTTKRQNNSSSTVSSQSVTDQKNLPSTTPTF